MLAVRHALSIPRPLVHAALALPCPVPSPKDCHGSRLASAGVYNIDWEAWKPAFDANTYNEYWIFINRSEALVKARHPEYSPAQVTRQASLEFNAASRTFWTESIRLCKRLRPKARWGWYNYPVDAWSAALSELSWLYDEVTALFPSIYLVSHNASANAQYVDRVLLQTRQVRDAIKIRTGRTLPMFSFAWLDYDLPAPRSYQTTSRSFGRA